MREDDRRTELFGGTMGGDARGPGPPPLKSCNKLFERKDDGSRVFKNKDYYRESTSMGVRDIIRRFEDIRTSAGVEEIQGCGLGGPEKSVMKQYLERKRTETYESPGKSRRVQREGLVQPEDSTKTPADGLGPGPGRLSRPPGPAWGGGPRAAPGSTDSLSLTSLLLIWEQGHSEEAGKMLLEPDFSSRE
jgi:hypothetical protein